MKVFKDFRVRMNVFASHIKMHIKLNEIYTFNYYMWMTNFIRCLRTQRAIFPGAPIALNVIFLKVVYRAGEREQCIQCAENVKMLAQFI